MMRPTLCLLGLALLLTGCSGKPGSPDGIWINHEVIAAAASSGNLREAVLAYGPNLEWQLDSASGRARFGNGFEVGEGHLRQLQPGTWQVELAAEQLVLLQAHGKQLEQTASDFFPAQQFSRPTTKIEATAPLGSSFERTLYAALLGGDWEIIDGAGQGEQLRFQADGRLQGFPGADRYALCLAGDCADMAGEHDSLWLQQGNRGRAWLFSLDGDELSLFEALNVAAPDEKPSYRPGARVWLLERD